MGEAAEEYDRNGRSVTGGLAEVFFDDGRGLAEV